MTISAEVLNFISAMQTILTEVRKISVLAYVRFRKSSSKTLKEASGTFYGYIWCFRVYNFRKN